MQSFSVKIKIEIKIMHWYYYLMEFYDAVFISEQDCV